MSTRGGHLTRFFLGAGAVQVGPLPYRFRAYPDSIDVLGVMVTSKLGAGPAGTSGIFDLGTTSTLTSLWTSGTRPTIAVGASADTLERVPSTVNVAAATSILASCLQKGSTVAGSDITVSMRWQWHTNPTLGAVTVLSLGVSLVAGPYQSRFGPFPFPVTILGVGATCGFDTPPSAATPAVLDLVTEAGASIWATNPGNRPTITNFNGATLAESVPDTTSLPQGQSLRPSAAIVDSSVPGGYAAMMVRWRPS